MPKHTTQGQSKTTADKERGLGYAFAVNMRIFKRKFGNRYPYHHFDLNSGGGWNDEVDCIGSPLAFLEQAYNHRLNNYFAGFCDNNNQAISSLLHRPEIADNPQCHVFHGDNGGLIEMIPHIIKFKGDRPHMALGMVLSDPNGSTGVPLEALEWLSHTCPGLDIVVHWASTQFKRDSGAFGRHRPTLDSSLARLNKQYWLIRKPLGRCQWTLLIGRNINCGGSRALGFYPLESPEGQNIFIQCNYTHDTRPPAIGPTQTELF